eukprot:scaffold67_cov155-Skeletonema_menzelii.AAC.10
MSATRALESVHCNLHNSQFYSDVGRKNAVERNRYGTEQGEKRSQPPPHGTCHHDDPPPP